MTKVETKEGYDFYIHAGHGDVPILWNIVPEGSRTPEGGYPNRRWVERVKGVCFPERYQPTLHGCGEVYKSNLWSGGRVMNNVKGEINKLQKEINALSEQMRVLANKRNALQELLDKPLVQLYVGRYFKFRNSDGNSSWWFYFRVVGAAKLHKHVFVDSIEVVGDRTSVTVHGDYHIGLLQHEITEKEFMKQWNNFLINYLRWRGKWIKNGR